VSLDIASGRVVVAAPSNLDVVADVVSQAQRSCGGVLGRNTLNALRFGAAAASLNSRCSAASLVCQKVCRRGGSVTWAKSRQMQAVP
jgi:hypothetical protein